MTSLASTLRANISFELRSILRRPTFYLATALLFIYWSIFSARLNMDPNFWGPKGGVFANAPVVVYFVLATQAFVTFLFVPLIMGQGPLREERAQLTQAWLAAPMNPVVALWGRFLAAFAILAVGTLLASCGILLSPYLRLALGKIPGLELGPVPWLHLLCAWATIILPTLFFASSLVFWAVVLTKRSSAAIASTLFLVLGAVISHYFGKTMHYEALQIIDPTAFHAVHRSVAYWTIEQRNHAFLPLSDLFLTNRALWLSAGIALSIVGSRTFKTSSFADPSRRRGSASFVHLNDQSTASGHRVQAVHAQGASLSLRTVQTFTRISNEIKRLAREPLFNAILLVFFLWLVGQNLGALELEFVKQPAQANLLLTARRGLWMLVFYFVPYVTASTVFFERDLPGAEYLDALPVPNWMQWLPKLIALALYCSLFPLLVLLASLVTQLAYADFHLDWSAYGQILATSYYPHLLQFVFAAFAISLLCPSRAVAYAATMLLLYASIFGYETANIDSELGLQMYEAMMVWSPFDGLGAYRSKVLFKSMFWLCVTLSWVTLATVFWKRGQRTRRPQQANVGRIVLLVSLIVASLGSARFVHQQDLAWNQSRLRPGQDSLRVHYERSLSKYRDVRTPTFGPSTMDIHLNPAKSSYDYRWSATIAANTFERNPTLLVQTPIQDKVQVTIDSTNLSPTDSFPELGAQVFTVSKGIPTSGMPVLSVEATHTFQGHPKKRQRPLGVLANGTYLNQHALPAFEYTPEHELQTELFRSIHKLPPRNTPQKKENPAKRSCPWSGRREAWNIEISTSKDQRAIAPGALIRSWIEGERKHFAYQSEHPDCSEFAFASATYQTRETQWSLSPTRILRGQIHFLAGYEDQAQQINVAVERALSRLTSILGPYPYGFLQVVQVRDDANLGVSPANTLFLREHEAWSLRVDTPSDEHQRLYFIALRLAQHWLHNQLAPAQAPGKGLFIEGIPSYLAHSWLGERFGESWLQKKYLHRAMRRYFWYHGTHTAVEQPVIHSPTIEHIHTYKAALALRVAAQTIGVQKLHACLRALLSNRNHEPATAADFLQRLVQAASPNEDLSLAQEMLSEIIHYDNRLEAAQTIQTKERFQLSLQIQANRWKTTPGNTAPSLIPWEKPLPILIRFSSNENSQDDEKIEYLDVKNGDNHINLTMNREPVEVWIDPKMQRLDLSLKDQRKKVTRNE